MKPFSLQTVLDYRKRLEDQAQHRLFQAQKIHRTIQQRYKDEQNSYSDLLQAREKLQKNGINITDLIRYEDWIDSVQNNLKSIQKTLDEKKKIVAQEQKNLLHRSKERQIMEKLRDQQNQAWRNYLSKKEATMLDEIAIIRHDSNTLDR